jgi:hypothetical protein
VENYGNPSTIDVVIDLVRPVTSVITKSIADEGGNKFARGQVPQQPVVETHGSDGDCDARFYHDVGLIGRFYLFPFSRGRRRARLPS